MEECYGQLNAPNSCFYDADMRAIEKTYNDAYVQFLGLRDGMSAVPYISNSLSDFYAITAGGGGSDPGRTMRNNFQRIWFKNYDKVNYLHFLGVRGPFRCSGFHLALVSLYFYSSRNNRTALCIRSRQDKF